MVVKQSLLKQIRQGTKLKSLATGSPMNLTPKHTVKIKSNIAIDGVTDSDRLSDDLLQKVRQQANLDNNSQVIVIEAQGCTIYQSLVLRVYMYMLMFESMTYRLLPRSDEKGPLSNFFEALQSIWQNAPSSKTFLTRWQKMSWAQKIVATSSSLLIVLVFLTLVLFRFGGDSRNVRLLMRRLRAPGYEQTMFVEVLQQALPVLRGNETLDEFDQVLGNMVTRSARIKKAFFDTLQRTGKVHLGLLVAILVYALINVWFRYNENSTLMDELKEILAQLSAKLGTQSLVDKVQTYTHKVGDMLSNWKAHKTQYKNKNKNKNKNKKNKNKNNQFQEDYLEIDGSGSEDDTSTTSPNSKLDTIKHGLQTAQRFLKKHLTSNQDNSIDTDSSEIGDDSDKSSDDSEISDISNLSNESNESNKSEHSETDTSDSEIDDDLLKMDSVRNKLFSADEVGGNVLQDFLSPVPPKPSVSSSRRSTANRKNTASRKSNSSRRSTAKRAKTASRKSNSSRRSTAKRANTASRESSSSRRSTASRTYNL